MIKLKFALKVWVNINPKWTGFFYVIYCCWILLSKYITKFMHIYTRNYFVLFVSYMQFAQNAKIYAIIIQQIFVWFSFLFFAVFNFYWDFSNLLNDCWKFIIFGCFGTFLNTVNSEQNRMRQFVLSNFV